MSTQSEHPDRSDMHPTERDEHAGYPDTTARPIPSGADPMAYRRPHPPDKPVRDDERAEPPRDDQMHRVDE